MTISNTLQHPAIPAVTVSGTDPFRPTDYTGLLMHVLRSRAHEFGKGSGLDMGMGSGVLLGTLGLLGVQDLYGVDIDPEAVLSARNLVRNLGLSEQTQLFEGSLWEPLGDRKFDVVVTNLPNFPATTPSDPDHSPYWSMAGADGRKLIDPFLTGLRQHLHDDGVAFMTHNVIVGLPETEIVLARHGLAARSILSSTTVLHPMKSALLSTALRARYTGVALNRLGPYEFTDVEVLEIRPVQAA